MAACVNPAAIIFLVLAAISTAAAASAAPPLELHLLPHTHADVGWLQTVNSLSRMNVSRILDGVVGNLANDTQKRRRFVWDEMAFLQLWWDEQATAAQKATFKKLVQERRIEFVDNGWSQHDMGCTTLDSMLNNWVEGHEWIRENIGAEYEPKIGWSLDPFGMSATQAVLQAQMGMEAWFFTRLTKSLVADMKKSKGLEFVWRASSSLPDADSEIFAHVFESYYCMPLPTYAFEWGPDKGAKVPTASNVEELAKGLADIAKQRAGWFRTPNVLIPWGCDYQYQNAELVYRSTDWLIDVMNNHTEEWGVHVRYTTPSEYLRAVRASAASAPPHAPVAFPVKSNGSSFFPFGDWSGYFTSRPTAKGLSTAAHASLNAAEQLFALHAAGLRRMEADKMWGLLETARRNAAIFQHHDAITGTFCAYAEGCAGVDQVVGSHDVLGSYTHMLQAAIAAADDVTATLATTVLLGSSAPAPLSTDVAVLGNLLMGDGNGGNNATLVVYNQLGHAVTEAVSVQVPVCMVAVRDATSGEDIPSQTTAMFTINDGQAPFFDFSLSFIANDIPPLGFKTYLLTPLPDAACHGGDTSLDDMIVPGGASAVRHRPGSSAANVATAACESALRAAAVASLQRDWQSAASRMLGSADEYAEAVQETMAQIADEDRPRQCATRTSTSTGHRSTGTASGDAAQLQSPVTLENAFLRVEVDTSSGVSALTDKATGKTYPLTHRLMQYAAVAQGMPAYVMKVQGPATPIMSNGSALASSVAQGPVLQEARIQVSQQHKTRVRLWVTDDPMLGRRLEFGHRIGVLGPMTEVVSRFTVDGIKSSTLFSEDNGYERIPHGTADGGVETNDIPTHVFPSQVSTWLLSDDGDDTQLSIALERSHGVASFAAGTIDVIQHRRGLPYYGSGGTVVLDDTDRIFTQSWLSLGNRTASNRVRAENKLRLNRPVQLLFGPAYSASASVSSSSAAAAVTRPDARILPPGVHLQSVRATSSRGDELIVRLQHLYAKGEDADLSVRVEVDTSALLSALLPSTVKASHLMETTLDGAQNVSVLAERQRYPAESDTTIAMVDEDEAEDEGGGAAAGGTATVMAPFQLRTFRVSLDTSMQ